MRATGFFAALREDLRIFAAKHAGQGPFKYFYYPDIRVVLILRLARLCHGLRITRPLAYLLVMANDFLHGVWIGPRVDIGRGLSLGHPRGLVVNPGTRIGSYCTIIHQVTLGGPSVTIGDYVEIGAGAKIISSDHRPVVIGSHSIIGAGAVVTRSIPPCSVVAGVPAQVIKRKDMQAWLELHPYYFEAERRSCPRT